VQAASNMGEMLLRHWIGYSSYHWTNKPVNLGSFSAHKAKMTH
jgi:hypothetical protein